VFKASYDGSNQKVLWQELWRHVQIAVHERGLAGDAAQPRVEPVQQALQPRAARGRQAVFARRQVDLGTEQLIAVVGDPVRSPGSGIMDGLGQAIAADGHLSNSLGRVHPRDRRAQFSPDAVLEDLP
jgi:hypothetical protein